ncbi:hypothetical protein QUC31_001570 [Theobroma cacao]|uniref:Serine-rich protein-related, putative n=1 Tax=Theobroma cacao TaxID=3641 RepID=A0A061FBS5_THECC|nr:Serine-rich protein-related, putative [Theobroma cacao]
MDERDEAKPPKIDLKGKNSKFSVPEINMDEIKRDSSMHVSPQGEGTKPAGGRWNCLCSPTTHAGSFRCRHHRASGMRRGGSVGSNLALLGATKSEPISDFFQAR